MSKIAVVTDSNSGITQKESAVLGIQVIPMPFFINQDLHYEDIDLTQEEFYKNLQEDIEISTSQPTPADIIEVWDELLKEHDEVVHIPMSSGLSTSCETAMGLAKEYDGKVQVVNNQRISVTLKQSVKDALELAAAGKRAAEIKEILEREKFESTIYIMVDTLKYLKKGGRITSAAAMIGTVLKLKPVLQIQGEKLDAFAKARSQKQAKKIMIDAIRNDFETKFLDAAERGDMHLAIAHTANTEEAFVFSKELAESFPGLDITLDPLSLSIACHIGPGSLAIACSKKIEY